MDVIIDNFISYKKELMVMIPISNEYGGGWNKVEGGYYTGAPTRSEFLATLSNINKLLVKASLYPSPYSMGIR